MWGMIPTRLKGWLPKPTLFLKPLEMTPRVKLDVIIEDERIIIEGRGVTPITPADDQLLDQDDQEEGTRAKTPSGVVTESLSQMNMDSPTSTLVVSDPPGGNQEA